MNWGILNILKVDGRFASTKFSESNFIAISMKCKMLFKNGIPQDIPYTNNFSLQILVILINIFESKYQVSIERLESAWESDLTHSRLSGSSMWTCRLANNFTYFRVHPCNLGLSTIQKSRRQVNCCMRNL